MSIIIVLFVFGCGCIKILTPSDGNIVLNNKLFVLDNEVITKGDLVEIEVYHVYFSEENLGGCRYCHYFPSEIKLGEFSCSVSTYDHQDTPYDFVVIIANDTDAGDPPPPRYHVAAKTGNSINVGGWDFASATLNGMIVDMDKLCVWGWSSQGINWEVNCKVLKFS